MTQQKSLKRRVRARMAKTGERYTAARRQVVTKPRLESGEGSGTLPAPIVEPDPATLSTSEAAMRRATGRSHGEWFALLDAWGATSHTHTEIAAWLAETHDAPSWWRQSITVDYERARGMRGRHEMRDGYSVSATKTVEAGAEAALRAFTDVDALRRWLPGAPLTPRATRAKLTARFDWAAPTSRVIVNVVPKGPDKSMVSVTHEQVPDAEAAARLKAFWRERLPDLAAELRLRH